MTNYRSNDSGVASPQAENDLKRIKGIGPAIEKHLVSSGIETIAQLAELTPEAIASLVPNISTKRIANQNWIHQARKLASANKKQKSGGQKETSSAQAVRQHYENFTLEFLLDENNNARRIRLMHIQGGEGATWSKWDANGIIDFLSKHTKANLAHLLPATYGSAEKKPDSKTSVGAEDKIRLLEWATYLTDTSQPLRTLPQNQKFDVKLSLDIAHTLLSDNSQLNITGTLFAKKLGSGARQVLGEIQSIVPYSQIINLTVGETTLPQGLYRLEAFITLIPSDTSDTDLPLKDSIDASFQGGLIQVY